MPVLPKPKKVVWTVHSRYKMRQYGLSPARVLRIVHSPARIEDGIADKTIAFMQKAGSKAHPHELWAMVQDAGSKRKVISAWRYPGTTKPRSEVALNFIHSELDDFIAEAEEADSSPKPDIKLNKWFKPAAARKAGIPVKKSWPKRKFNSFKDIKFGKNKNT